MNVQSINGSLQNAFLEAVNDKMVQTCVNSENSLESHLKICLLRYEMSQADSALVSVLSVARIFKNLQMASFFFQLGHKKNYKQNTIYNARIAICFTQPV